MKSSAFSSIKRSFPALGEFERSGVVYLDNAATTQKPSSVIAAMNDFYTEGYGNINRSAHPLGERTTERWEAARRTVKRFLKLPDSHELIFTRGATEASNLAAYGLSSRLGRNAPAAVGLHDHHALFVPWQQACMRSDAPFLVYRVDPEGRIDQRSYDAVLAQKPAVVCITAVSHVTGAKPALAPLLRAARSAGAITVVDGSQEVGHGDADLSDDTPDFYFFSAHKMYGPTGIGALIGRIDLLESMPPVLFGGDMVSSVTAEDTSFAEIPRRFEAGTQPLAEAAGLAAACEFLSTREARAALADEGSVTAAMLRSLSEIPDITVYGPRDVDSRKGIISFSFDGVHAHDVGELLSRRGICTRTGHHCAQPYIRSLGATALTRVSTGIYSTADEASLVSNALFELSEYLKKKAGNA